MPRTSTTSKADPALDTLAGIVRRLRAKVAADERYWHALPLVKSAEDALSEGRAQDAASFIIEIEQALDAKPRARSWNVLRVAPHMERRVRDRLAEDGLEVYVPIETRWPRGYNRMTRAEKLRARPITRPLIPGLVFAHLPDDEALDVVKGNQACRLLIVGEKPVRVPAREIGFLIFAEACHRFDETWAPPRKRGLRRRHVNSRWKGGERVRVTEGAFAGLFGEVIRANREDRLAVAVELFGRITPVEVDEEWIEPVAEREAA